MKIIRILELLEFFHSLPWKNMNSERDTLFFVDLYHKDVNNLYFKQDSFEIRRDTKIN